MRFVMLKATCLSMLLLAAPLGCGREEESIAPPDRTGKIVRPSKTGGGPPAHARGKPIDASYVATCFPAAVVIHPARIARSPLAASLLQEAPVAAAVRKTSIDISSIEEIVVLLPPPGKGGPNPKQDLPCFIVRFSKPIVARELVAKFFAAVLPQFAELQAAQFEGRACYRVAAAPWVLVHAPTDRTLLVAAEDRLRAMLAEPKGRGPLAERLAAADGDHDAILAVAAEPVHEFVHDGVQDARRHAPPPIVAIAEGVEVLQGGTLAADLAGEMLLTAELTGNDPTAGEKIEQAVRQAQQMAAREWANARRQMPRPVLDHYGPALELAVQAFRSLEIEREGDRVAASAQRPAEFDKIVRELVLGLF